MSADSISTRCFPETHIPTLLRIHRIQQLRSASLFYYFQNTVHITCVSSKEQHQGPWISLHSILLSYWLQAPSPRWAPKRTAPGSAGGGTRGSCTKGGLLGRSVPAVGRVSPAEDVGDLRALVVEGWKGGKLHHRQF